MTQTVIEMRGIDKRFGDFYANKNINFDLQKGEIHALLGENGAGKSTMMNMLSGLLEPTSGQIYLNGDPVTIDSPSKGNALGIGMVHQHFMLIEDFTVVENIILGAEPIHGPFLNKSQAQADIEDLSKRYGMYVDPTAKISDISVGQQQRVEILKVLYRGADILIFDEPTASLTPQEIEELMVTLRSLAQEGKSIILITHKLDEIMAIADRCTVIRRGETVGTVSIDHTNSQELATMMVGRNVMFKLDKQDIEPGDLVIEVKGIEVEDSRGLPAVKGVDFEVHSGEIVGIAGIDGNGQTELILALTGLQAIKSGTVNILGHETQSYNPRQLHELGVGHIPEDRHKHGLILTMPLDQNIALKDYYHEPYSKNGVLNYTAIGDHAKELIEKYDVRTVSEKVPASALSGGNQQKAIIAREVSNQPRLLVAANPTRGLDVGAIESIHQGLLDQRDQGDAIILMSFELDEIMNLSDRILVMYNGEIIANLPAGAVNEQEIGLMMAGTSYEEVVRLRQEGVEAHG